MTRPEQERRARQEQRGARRERERGARQEQRGARRELERGARQEQRGARRGRPLDPRRDDAILDAVVALLRRAGPGRVAMRDVAERSGTSLAAVYRRWPSREDLLADAVARFVVADTPMPASGDVRADLLTILDVMTRRRRAFVESLPGLFAEAAANPQFAGVLRKRLLGVADQAIRTLLRQARASGLVSPEADVDLATDAVIALYLYQPLVYGRAPTRAYATRIVDRAALPMLGLAPPVTAGPR